MKSKEFLERESNSKFFNRALKAVSLEKLVEEVLLFRTYETFLKALEKREPIQAIHVQLK